MDIGDILLLVILIGVPVISAIAKAIQEKTARKQAERKKSVPRPVRPRPGDGSPPATPEPSSPSGRAWENQEAETEEEEPQPTPYDTFREFLEPASKKIASPPPPIPPPAERAPVPLPEKPRYKSLVEQLASREKEHVSEAVKHDIEDQVRQDISEEKWKKREDHFQWKGGLLGPGPEKPEKIRMKHLLPSRMSPEDLRRAIVLTELFSPPLSLREPGQGPVPPFQLG